MKKVELVKYLNTYLKSKTFDDPWFINDLEIDAKKDDIKKIWVAVDCTTYIIDRAVKAKVDMLLVHHGLHFDPSLIAAEKERIQGLKKNNLALYASHIPLDIHPLIGNNAVLIEKFTTFFGIKNFKRVPFGKDNWVFYGYAATFTKKVPVTELKKFCKHIGIAYDLRNYGDKKYIQSIAILSGSANGVLPELFKKKYDLYITGELKHSSFCKCKEMEQSVLLGGHYETEVFGVLALARHLKEKFGVKTVFLDEKY